MDDRTATGLWIEAKLRQLDRDAIFYYIINKGAYFSGTVLLKINNLSGICRILIQETDERGEKKWISPLLKSDLSESDADSYILRTKNRDPDIWIIEIEERGLMNPLDDQKNDKGFTLVELSIVMIIIGLLIGGVLKGQQLIENARAKKVVSFLKSVQSATYTFQDTYKSLPGDISSATVLIPDCNSSTFCEDGNGNNYIASDGTDQYAWGTPIITRAEASRFESVQYWKHLALANLIGDINGHANPNAPAFGETHPESPFGSGGFEVYWDGLTTLHPTGVHIVRLSGNDSLTGGDTLSSITPQQAAKIDKLMDDGQPNSGSVFANYGRVTDNCKIGGPTLSDNSEYNGAMTSNECVLFFKIF